MIKNKIYILEPIRTNNFIDLGVKIISHWELFLSMGFEKDVKYAIYYNYDSNYKGDYDFTIGVENEFKGSLPLEIPSLKYQKIDSTQASILDSWKIIWELEEQGKIKRNYIFDFEKHLSDGKIEIYIGILK